MKLLVSTWGLPRDWKDATYEFEGTFLKSCTTLGLLSRKYDKVVVLVLDSIVDAVARVDLNTSCGECFKKHWRDFTGNDYPSLIQHVKETIHGILECLGVYNADVIVLPATGSPSGVWNFEGNMKDYMSIGLIRLYRYVKECAQLDEVAIDLTHGINFMPALSFRMVQIVSQLSYLYQNREKSIVFRAFNSDPFTSIANLRINEVYKEIVSSVEIPAKIPVKAILKKERADSDFGYIEKHFSDIIGPLISSVFYPFPLALARFCKKQAFVDLEEVWRKQIVIAHKRVTRKVFLDPLAVQVMLLADILNHKVEPSGKIQNLEKMNDTIYKKISVIQHDLIGNELNGIKNDVGKYEGPYPRRLCEIKGKCGTDIVNKRIMIAHAGLQKEFVVVRGDLTLEYTNDPLVILKNTGLLL